MIELCCEYLSVQCIWLYVIIMSRTSFRVNPHSIVCLNVKEILAWSRCYIRSLRDININEIRTHNHLVPKYSQQSAIIWPVWLHGWVFVYELNGCGFKFRCSHILVGLYGFIGNKVLLHWRRDNTIVLHKVYPCRKVNTTEFIHIRLNLYENMTFFKKHGGK